MILRDTLTKAKRLFAPLGDPVKLYVCGVTPYDTTHLGHARTYVVFDVLHRYLRATGHKVRYVQNITDVDEPLFRRAAQLGIPYDSLAAQNLARYFADMAMLRVLPATEYPRASTEIPDMIQVVGLLVEQGHAYVRDGTVFFRIASVSNYGELSGLSRSAMVAESVEHGNDPSDRRKEDSLDFVLWRPAMKGECSWPSPWGPGLPGWHIECSTMALKYLGEGIDIHGGGEDLIYPHHENEIAQSEALTGVRPFARFWLHTGVVRLDGIKMSKSLGNLVMLGDVLHDYSVDAVRLYLLGFRYRQAFDYRPQGLMEAESLARRLRLATGTTQEGVRVVAQSEGVAVARQPRDGDVNVLPFRRRFAVAMDDDLDTPAAIKTLSDLAEVTIEAMGKGRDVQEAQRTLIELAALLL